MRRPACLRTLALGLCALLLAAVASGSPSSLVPVTVWAPGPLLSSQVNYEVGVVVTAGGRPVVALIGW